MRQLHSRFHPVKLTNLKIGFGHIGIERQRSFFSSSVSSWWIPVEVEATEEHLLHLLLLFHLDLLLLLTTCLHLLNHLHLGQEFLHLHHLHRHLHHQECRQSHHPSHNLLHIHFTI